MHQGAIATTRTIGFLGRTHLDFTIPLRHYIGKHGQTDPVRTVQIDPFKTVETDPPLGLDIKVAFGRFLGNRILLA